MLIYRDPALPLFFCSNFVPLRTRFRSASVDRLPASLQIPRPPGSRHVRRRQVPSRALSSFERAARPPRRLHATQHSPRRSLGYRTIPNF